MTFTIIITGAELRERVPALTAAATGQAVAAGLLVPLGEDYVFLGITVCARPARTACNTV